MAGNTHRFMTDVPYVTSPDPVPDDLRDRIASGKCVLFLGAGASLGARDQNGERLPSWATLINELWARVNRETPQDQMVLEEVTDLLHPEIGELLIVTEWIEKEIGMRSFADYLRTRLGTASRSPLHELLSDKKFKAVITTNYDDLAERHWAERGKAPFMVLPHTSTAQAGLALSTMTDPTSNQVPIIKIHGSWNQPDSLVFGPRSYREIMFANEGFRSFMANIFATYTVLFVGLSFRDPNLQSVLQWIYTLLKGDVPTHYATLENRGRVFKNYMRQNFNIRMLTYPVPPADHSRCLDILRAL